MDKKSEEYLRQYIKLTDTIKQKIEAHAARYHIKAEICAWYSEHLKMEKMSWMSILKCWKPELI